MKKSELLELVVVSSVAIGNILEDAGLSKTVIGSVNVELDKIKDLVAPKVGGVVTDVNEVFRSTCILLLKQHHRGIFKA